MRKRKLGLWGASALVLATVAVAPLDGAGAHTCARVRTWAPTSTTIGDATCGGHEPATHTCVTKTTGNSQDPVGEITHVEVVVCEDQA